MMSNYNDNGDDGASLLFNNYPLFVKDTIIKFPCVTTIDPRIIDNTTNFSPFEVRGMVRLMYDSTKSGNMRGKKVEKRKMAKHSRVTPYRGKEVE